MNISKTVRIGHSTYRMHQVAYTGWVFVRGTTSRSKSNTYSVAQIVDGEIVAVDRTEAINGATNHELARAWISQ